MMKALEKILSLMVCLVLVMTLVPTVFAEGLNVMDLVIEDIAGHQPANMITETLMLPEGYTWTAEPAGIINTETGAVTRDTVKDKAVTLTANANGETKNFNFVVKSKMTKVLVAESFAYDYEEGANATAKDDFIFSTIRTATTHPILKETNGNSYFEADWTYVDDVNDPNRSDKKNSKRLSLRNIPEEFQTAEDIYISFKFKYVGTSYVNMKLSPGGTEKQAAAFGFNNSNFRYSWSQIHQSPGYSYSGYNADGTDEWITAYYKYNFDSVSGAISSDGITYTDLNALGGEEATDKKLTDFSFAPASVGSDGGKVILDDFVIYTESMDNLTGSDKEEYIAAELDKTVLTDEKSGAVTKDLNLPSFDGMVTWTSSDTSVISVQDEKGVIGTRDKAIFKTAVLTATYGTKTKKFSFAVAPLDTTTIIRTNTTCELLEDFENGADGSAVTIVQGGNYNTTTGWTAANAEVVGRSFKYAEDSVKGMVGKLTDSTGTTVSLVPGNACGAQFRYTTGFDFKFNPENSTDSFSFSISGAIQNSNIVVTKNNVRVYHDGHVYPNQYIDYAVNTDSWIRIDIDTNMASRTQEVFVNGVSLTGVLKNGTYSQQYSTNVTSNTLRFLNFTANGATPVYIDNIAVAGHTNDDRSLADAGVKAAQVFYNDGLVATKILEANGPVCVSAILNDKATFANGGAALVWSGSDVNGNSFAPAKVGDYTLTVTATKGSETATGTVSFKGAPVILGENDGKITVAGTQSGGKLIVAQYNGESSMVKVTVYESFENVPIPDGNYKAFFITDLLKLLPGAFPLIK